jgi:hypothetical protein
VQRCRGAEVKRCRVEEVQKEGQRWKGERCRGVEVHRGVEVVQRCKTWIGIFDASHSCTGAIFVVPNMDSTYACMVIDFLATVHVWEKVRPCA